ncbi:hypothetical protein HKBW3S03_01182, partial [Candidatus Hakubella thermalkaliphila]
CGPKKYPKKRGSAELGLVITDEELEEGLSILEKGLRDLEEVP